MAAARCGDLRGFEGFDGFLRGLRLSGFGFFAVFFAMVDPSLANRTVTVGAVSRRAGFGDGRAMCLKRTRGGEPASMCRV